METVKDKWLPGVQGDRGLNEQVKPWGVLGQWVCSVWYRNGGYMSSWCIMSKPKEYTAQRVNPTVNY